ncbi:MAG: ComF family protein [Actinomycetota bacterium]
MLAALLDALFPKRCAGCGSGPWPFCAACRSELVVLSPPWCERCGAPAPRPTPTCRDCPPDPIEIARAPFGFDGPVRRAIHRLKFGGWRAVADALAEAMVQVWTDVSWAPSAIAWVPLSHDRLAARGYDQAEALARAVAPRLGLPVRPLVRRVADPGPQARRGAAARREAMRGMFAAVGASGRVLLVDDVLTTGATGSACASSLLAAGAEAVGLLTAARAASSARRPAPILGHGLASGSVVAPGNGSPAVDASRGRSDPRKPTLGR